MRITRRINLDHPDAATLAETAGIIRSGGIIVYPTETVYGIGANAFDSKAVRRVTEVKKRAEHKPIPLIIRSQDDLRGLVENVNESAEALIRAFWPGPLTMVFRSSSQVPDEVTQGTGSVGVRIPSSTVCLELLLQARTPITATSANLSGGTVPRTVSEIQQLLSAGVDLYLDAGELPVRKPSTVIDVSGDVPRLIRDGAIPMEHILKVIPNVER